MTSNDSSKNLKNHVLMMLIILSPVSKITDNFTKRERKKDNKYSF